ncbi:MAG: GTP cyclohydrolase IIa [Candidatus Jordarchaeales archaeon]
MTLIKITLVQLDNYGPWTEELGEDREADIQVLQSELYADLQRMFSVRGGLLFFTRFDNMLAVSNGVDLREHEVILRSIARRYPVTVSMGVGLGETAYEAQRAATRVLQSKGSAQSSERRAVLAYSDNGAKESYVQIAHIDVDDFTSNVTDREDAYKAMYIISDLSTLLMKLSMSKGALTFFNGGDNFISVCNGLTEYDFEEILDKLETSVGLKLKAGVGFGRNASEALSKANKALSKIRRGVVREPVLFLGGPPE